MLSVDSGSIPKDTVDRNDPTSMKLDFWLPNSLSNFTKNVTLSGCCPPPPDRDHTFYLEIPNCIRCGRTLAPRGWFSNSFCSNKKRRFHEFSDQAKVRPAWRMIFLEKVALLGTWTLNVNILKCTNNLDSPLILSLTSVSCCPTASIHL